MSGEEKYKRYKPLKEPYLDLLHQIDQANVAIVNLSELPEPEIEEWRYQIRCLRSVYYPAYSGWKKTPQDIFQKIAHDRFDRAQLAEEIIAVASDNLTGQRFLAGNIRVISADNNEIPPLSVMDSYSVNGAWPHEVMRVPLSEVGEISRLVVPNWIRDKASVVRELDKKAISLSANKRLRLLYYIGYSPLQEITLDTEDKKVENAILLHKQPNARRLYPGAVTFASYFSDFWEANKPALFYTML